MNEQQRAISETLTQVQHIIDSLPPGDPLRRKAAAQKARLEIMLRTDDDH